MGPRSKSTLRVRGSLRFHWKDAMSRFTFKRFCAALAVALPLGAIVALAQAPGPGGPAGRGPAAGGPPPPGFGGPPPPTQGFESNIQIPATYTPQEAAAVAVVE